MTTEITNEQLFRAAARLKAASATKEELEVERARLKDRLTEIDDLLAGGDYDFNVQAGLARMMVERNMKVLIMDDCVFMLTGHNAVTVADGLYVLQSNEEKENGAE